MTITVHHPPDAPRRQVRVTRGARIVHDTRPADSASRSAAKELRLAGCAHRGDETRRIVCRTCSGRVSVKVLACAVHGECTIAKAASWLHVCTTCGDWKPLEGSLP